MRYFVRAAVVALIGLPLPAVAEPEAGALLTQISGVVLVDSGDGFIQASENARLKFGDRVMVTKGGGALLSYGESCSFPLQAPSMTIVEETGCTTTTQDTRNGGTALPVAAGLSILANLALLGGVFDEEGRPVSP